MLSFSQRSTGVGCVPGALFIPPRPFTKCHLLTWKVSPWSSLVSGRSSFPVQVLNTSDCTGMPVAVLTLAVRLAHVTSWLRSNISVAPFSSMSMLAVLVVSCTLLQLWSGLPGPSSSSGKLESEVGLVGADSGVG